jgi:hypothetical protein
VGRGHLIRLAGGYALVLALAVAVPAAAATHALSWTLLASGQATTGSSQLEGVLAGSRTAAHRIVVRVPPAAAQKALTLDYRRRVALAVFGDWGCRAKRVRISSIERAGATLAVRLRLEPLPPGVMECQALYPTFLLASLSRAELGRPLPSRIMVSFART